ncbi:MAG: hypothetical protein ACO3RV_05025, partial [Luteolibacter sp.]
AEPRIEKLICLRLRACPEMDKNNKSNPKAKMIEAPPVAEIQSPKKFDQFSRNMLAKREPNAAISPHITPNTTYVRPS